MESLKKILPYILVAVVFAVGGYFIGRGTVNDQGAALYNAGSITNPCNNSPTNPCPEGFAKKPVDVFAGIRVYTNTSTACIAAGGVPGNHADTDGVYKGMWPCELLKQRPDTNTGTTGVTGTSGAQAKMVPTGNTTAPGVVVYVLNEEDCAKLGGTLGGGVTTNSGGHLFRCNLIAAPRPTTTPVSASTTVTAPAGATATQTTTKTQ